MYENHIKMYEIHIKTIKFHILNRFDERERGGFRSSEKRFLISFVDAKAEFLLFCCLLMTIFLLSLHCQIKNGNKSIF